MDQNNQQPPYLNNGQQQGNYGTPPPQPPFGQAPQQPYNQYPGMSPMGNIPPEPGFIGSIKLFFSQYAQFSGRSRRQEYWYVVLFTFLLDLVLTIGGLSTLSSLVSIAFIIPNLALQCRRLHDIGKSGHWIWLNIAASIMFVVSMLYVVMYFIAYIPEMHDELMRQGIDPSIFYSLYPLLDIPGWGIVGMVVIALAVKITFLVFNCTDSNHGTNQYGPSQKYPDAPIPSW